MTEVKLSSEAMMVGYLMEVGWELHVSSDQEHGIYKQTKVGRVTRVDSVSVSVDCIMELQQAGMLKKLKQFVVNHKKTTVYGLAKVNEEKT